MAEAVIAQPSLRQIIGSPEPTSLNPPAAPPALATEPVMP